MSADPHLPHGTQIFVSYPRGGLGHTWAEKIQTYLEELGAEVFRDEESIREGEQDWYQRIEEGINRADLLVCVIGDDSGRSDWQTREMLQAVEGGKLIVPLRIAEVSLPLYLKEKQPVELRKDDEEKWPRKLRLVSK